MDVSRRMNHRDVMDRLAELFIDRGVPECLRSSGNSGSGLSPPYPRLPWAIRPPLGDRCFGIVSDHPERCEQARDCLLMIPVLTLRLVPLVGADQRGARLLTESVYRGFDLSSEILYCLHRPPGQALFCLQQQKVEGFLAVSRSKPNEIWGVVRPGPNDTSILLERIGEIEHRPWTRRILGNHETINFRYNTLHWRLTDILIDASYRVKSDMTCLLARGSDANEDFLKSALVIHPWCRF